MIVPKIEDIQKAQKTAEVLEDNAASLVATARELLTMLRVAELFPEIMGSGKPYVLRQDRAYRTAKKLVLVHGQEEKPITQRQMRYIETGVWK